MTTTSHDSETPAHHQQVITACAFIHHNFDDIEKVFLAKRADAKKFLPSVYELPGGHIDFGENIVAGLIREIDEEFGMPVEIGDPFAAFAYTNHIKGSHSIEVVYFAHFAKPIDQIRLNPDDHSDAGWFSESELPDAYADTKEANDTEFVAMQKAFALLRGEQPIF